MYSAGVRIYMYIHTLYRNNLLLFKLKYSNKGIDKGPKKILTSRISLKCVINYLTQVEYGYIYDCDCVYIYFSCYHSSQLCSH